MPSSNYSEKRAAEILEVIMHYARLDFSVKIPVDNNNDVFDAISAGVNMLGEELNSSSVSLKEKNQLLREIHHRVKNNMQIISSLLNLHADYVKDERFAALIKICRNRINAMAIIHEMLYASPDFKYTNFFEYAFKLMQSLVRSYNISDREVRFDLQIDKSVSFDVDRMIPLGLILNEIVTNSLKYAIVPETGHVNISIHLHATPGGSYELHIADNGPGLPENFDVKEHANLGMQLIYMLAEQINSKVELHNANGTAYIFEF